MPAVQTNLPTRDDFAAMLDESFGGSDMSTLAVTITQGHFFKAQTNRVGWAMYPLLGDLTFSP